MQNLKKLGCSQRLGERKFLIKHQERPEKMLFFSPKNPGKSKGSFHPSLQCTRKTWARVQMKSDVHRMPKGKKKGLKHWSGLVRQNGTFQSLTTGLGTGSSHHLTVGANKKYRNCQLLHPSWAQLGPAAGWTQKLARVLRWNCFPGAGGNDLFYSLKSCFPNKMAIREPKQIYS